MSELEPQLEGAVTIVVPAFQEAESLPSTLVALKKVADPYGWPILVVDDGSSDGTHMVAEQAGVSVVRHKVNRGYGGALKTGIRSARTHWVISFDADGQHDPADIERLLKAGLEQDADLVVGDRGGHVSSRYRRIGKWFISLLTRVLVPSPVNDLNSGIKLIHTDLARRYLQLCPNSMAFSNVITLVFLSYRHRVIEHPVSIRNRFGGTSTITTHTALETVVEVINLLTLFNPMRLFIPLALLAWCAGLGWGIPIVLAGRGVSVGSMLAIVTGVILAALGLLAEQLAAIRKHQSPEDPRDE